MWEHARLPLKILCIIPVTYLLACTIQEFSALVQRIAIEYYGTTLKSDFVYLTMFFSPWILSIITCICMEKLND